MKRYSGPVKLNLPPNRREAELGAAQPKKKRNGKGGRSRGTQKIADPTARREGTPRLG